MADMRSTGWDEEAPDVPKPIIEFAANADLSVYHAHFLHPSKSGQEDVHYMMLGQFLPREGDGIKEPTTQKPYKVQRVIHGTSPINLSGHTAYASKAHIVCIPAKFDEKQEPKAS